MSCTRVITFEGWYKLGKGEPLASGYGQCLYERIFAEAIRQAS
jgi:hypothetical protein